jgi:hypothetical protein
MVTLSRQALRPRIPSGVFEARNLSSFSASCHQTPTTKALFVAFPIFLALDFTPASSLARHADSVTRSADLPAAGTLPGGAPVPFRSIDFTLCFWVGSHTPLLRVGLPFLRNAE